MQPRFVRHLAAIILLTLGVFLGLFSLPVGFGWHRTLSVLGIAFFAVGYTAVLAGHWLLRDSDWQLLIVPFIKWLLLLGSTLLLCAGIAIAIRSQDMPIPYGYLVVTGCLSFVGYLRFRKYIED